MCSGVEINLPPPPIMIIHVEINSYHSSKRSVDGDEQTPGSISKDLDLVYK